MLVLNFAHPLTAAQQQQIEELSGHAISAVHHHLWQVDQAAPLAPQAAALADAVPLSGAEWQTTPLIVNPPGLAPAAAVLLAELHGRMGYFPAVVRIRPLPGVTPLVFEVAEIINLQHVREEARVRRATPRT